VQIEDVTRVSFTSRRTAQQQGDLASGYGEQSATIKKDLIELKTSLKGLRQWFVWWARTKNGGQAAAESLGRLNKIIKTIEDGNPRPNQSESP
jgi:ribosomal protein S11